MCACGRIASVKGLCRLCYSRKRLKERQNQKSEEQKVVIDKRYELVCKLVKKGYSITDACILVGITKVYLSKIASIEQIDGLKKLQNSMRDMIKEDVELLQYPRKTVDFDEIYQSVITRVKNGIPIYRACVLTGISRVTFYKSINLEQKKELQLYRSKESTEAYFESLFSDK